MLEMNKILTENNNVYFWNSNRKMSIYIVKSVYFQNTAVFIIL